jgi:hypothetical protein
MSAPFRGHAVWLYLKLHQNMRKSAFIVFQTLKFCASLKGGMKDKVYDVLSIRAPHTHYI